jgi:hypothetical protein
MKNLKQTNVLKARQMKDDQPVSLAKNQVKCLLYQVKKAFLGGGNNHL